MKRLAFKGNVVLITGASAGIGQALAREFAAQGAKLVLLARREDRLRDLAEECGRMGAEALPLECDVTRDGDLEEAARVARDRFGRIDVVIANAGFAVGGRMDRLSLEDYRRQFETNVFGLLRTVYATLADLGRSRGRLVLIGSVAGHLSAPETSAYSMSKFAVRALAEALVTELRPQGVSVTLISPGFVESEIYRVDNRGNLREQRARDEVPSWIRVPTPVAAREIVRAVRKRSPERVVTGHGKVLVFLQRHFPGLMRFLLSRL